LLKLWRDFGIRLAAFPRTKAGFLQLLVDAAEHGKKVREHGTGILS
jgi:hypothetical protein